MIPAGGGEGGGGGREVGDGCVGDDGGNEERHGYDYRGSDS